MQKNILIILINILLLCSCQERITIEMFSPERSVDSKFWISDRGLKLGISYKGRSISDTSLLGFFNDSLLFEIKSVITDQFDYTWEAVNAKNKTVRNCYNSYLISLNSESNPELDYKIEFRLYNDGIAFRYLINGSNKKDLIPDEKTTIIFKNDPELWSYNGENHNIYQNSLSQSALREFSPPTVFKLDSNLYSAILEAAIMEHGPFLLYKTSENQSLRIKPQQEDWEEIFHTSWRVIQLGESAGSLIESDILVNLNEECQIEDPSWIKPGKVMWDWRVWGYKAADGFEYGLDTESHMRFVDFASENNIQYLLLDADWYGPEFDAESDPGSSNYKIRIEEFMEYASDKGIGIILYLNDLGAKKFGLERIFHQFSEWGAVGVKYGFMRGSWEEKVAQTRRIVELCADYKLMVNFHDNPVPPSGDRRTWPNLVTKEFCHSQADAKRSYFPETAVTSVFVNMLAGPLDMCGGWFDLNNSVSRVKVFEEIPGTVAAELAKLVIYYSGWHILSDSPEEYLKKEDLFNFIREMPAEFDNYKVIEGEIGEYICVARKKDEQWFVACLSNRSSRELTITPDFLDADSSYKATVYEDGPETNFLDNKEEYNIRSLDKVNSESTLHLTLAPGGGCAISFKKIK